MLEEPTPTDYHSHVSSLVRVREAFHLLLALQLERPLRAHLASHPAETLPEKRELCHAIGDDLRRLGLAVRSPATGKPAELQAAEDRHPGQGRFLLALLGQRHDRKRTTMSTSQMADVRLTTRPMRQESMSARARRSKEAGDGSGRSV